MSVVRKAPARDVVTESLFEFVFSDATRDRHGDTINPHGWDIREFQKRSNRTFEITIRISRSAGGPTPASRTINCSAIFSWLRKERRRASTKSGS